MFYVYFLKSTVNGFIYVGSCGNINKRLLRHNSGKVKSTKAYKPWTLLGYETANTRGEAMAKEKFYKTGQQKELLKKKYEKV
jgi:putative endonuclease